MNEGDVASY